MWLDVALDLFSNKEPPTFKNEKPWTWGCLQWRDRLREVARHCVLNWQGDLVEIGCYTGGGTKILAEIARKHGRRVIAIDPWGPETQGTATEFALFLRNMNLYLDITDIWRVVSQHRWVKRALARRSLCFAFVDGSHTYKDALSDILAVSHASVISVDDVLWNGNLDRALRDGAQATNKRIVRHKLCREAYLLRS